MGTSLHSRPSASTLAELSAYFYRFFSYFPMRLGDYVRIGAHSIVEAAQIGSHVDIGERCVIVRDQILPSRFYVHACLFEWLTIRVGSLLCDSGWRTNPRRRSACATYRRAESLHLCRITRYVCTHVYESDAVCSTQDRLAS